MAEESGNRVSEMVKRRTTGILLAVLLLTLWYLKGWPLRIGLVVMMVLSIHEMYSAFCHRGARPVKWVGIAYALLAMPVYLYYGAGALGPLTALSCMAGLTAIVLRGKVDFESAVATLFPLIYPGMLITLIFPLQDLKPPLFATVALGLCFLVALGNDLAAYEVGMRVGKTKLCPELSPKKTVEGAIAGVLGSMAMAVLIPLIATFITRALPAAHPYYAILPPLWHFAVIGLLGGIASPVGDLTASMAKRYCGIKDFGSIFPGHGGMLDRIDSVIFSGAIVYIYFELVIQVL